MNAIETAGNAHAPTIPLELFHSEVTSIQTTVYARVRLPGVDPDDRLQGTVRGPFSLVSQTLPATFQCTDCGPGETLLAKTCIPDPCAWSPRLPANYRAELQVVRAGQVIHELTADFGIRNLVPSGRSLLLSGQRVVLRGVDLNRAEWDAVGDWNKYGSTILVSEPDEALCRAASDQGVIICARLVGDNQLIERFRRIVCFPCVSVVWIHDGTIDASLKQIAPNVLIAAAADDALNRKRADLLIWTVGNLIADAPPRFDKPAIALRPLSQSLPLAEARAACDRLQRDLAPQHDLAGYFV